MCSFSFNLKPSSLHYQPSQCQILILIDNWQDSRGLTDFGPPKGINRFRSAKERWRIFIF